MFELSINNSLRDDLLFRFCIEEDTGYLFAELQQHGFIWREQIRLSGWTALLLWLPVPLLAGTGLMATFITLALVYTTFWVGFVPKGQMLAYNRLGDYSYGVYIYAFPVQQLLVWQFPGMAPVTNILLAAPVTLGLAILSWKLVEVRAIAAGTSIAERIAVLLRLSPRAPDQSV